MKIHLVTSSASAGEALRGLLDTEFVITESNIPGKALDDIRENNPAAVIINWSSSMDGITDFCRDLRKQKVFRSLYILVIAPREKEKEMHRVLQAGANDFIFKPFGKTELYLRLEIARRMLKLEESLSRTKKKLIRLAKEDPVTNLLNSRALFDESLKEMGRAAREMKYVSAIMVRIANFRELSDTEGAMFANAILAEFGRTVKALCRPYDKIGRYGIAEFLVILPDTGIPNAERIAGRIISTFTNETMVVRDRSLSIKASAGISELNPTDVARDNDPEGLLRNDRLLDALIGRAEMAMTRAEKKKGLRVEIYQP